MGTRRLFGMPWTAKQDLTGRCWIPERARSHLKLVLVQIYHSDLAKSIGSEQKLLPMWSEPHRIQERMLNSYKVETLEGHLLEGEYHARRLRDFVPRDG